MYDSNVYGNLFVGSWNKQLAGISVIVFFVYVFIYLYILIYIYIYV
jgi:hypothetical protein